MKRLLVCWVVALMLAGPALAGPNDPVRLSDIRGLLGGGKDVDQVLVVMSERGIDFRVTASAERKLKQMGFTDAHLRQVNRIAAGLPIEADAPADDAPDQAEGAGLPDEFPIGFALGEEVGQWQDRAMSRALKGARLDYKVYKFGRFALYCSPRRAKELTPLLEKLERDLSDKMPESIANAIEPRTATLILVDSRAHGYKMLDTIIKSYRVDQPDYMQGFRDKRDWDYWVASHCVIVDGSSYKTAPAAMRPLSFGIGNMIASHLAYYDEPDALAMGLGNVVETLACGSPSITLFSESGRDEADIADWRADFIQRRGANRLPAARTVLDYGTQAMKPRHYVESWTLARHLASQPDKLYRTLYRCRDRQVPVIDLIMEEYGVDEKQLNQQWKQSVGN